MRLESLDRRSPPLLPLLLHLLLVLLVVLASKGSAVDAHPAHATDLYKVLGVAPTASDADIKRVRLCPFCSWFPHTSDCFVYRGCVCVCVGGGGGARGSIIAAIRLGALFVFVNGTLSLKPLATPHLRRMASIGVCTLILFVVESLTRACLGGPQFARCSRGNRHTSAWRWNTTRTKAGTQTPLSPSTLRTKCCQTRTRAGSTMRSEGAGQADGVHEHPVLPHRHPPSPLPHLYKLLLCNCTLMQ